MNPENCDIKQKAAPQERPRAGMSEEPGEEPGRLCGEGAVLGARRNAEQDSDPQRPGEGHSEWGKL